MQPYTIVKDHRTNAETGNVDAVMDGGIDLFINAYLEVDCPRNRSERGRSIIRLWAEHSDK